MNANFVYPFWPKILFFLNKKTNKTNPKKILGNARDIGNENNNIEKTISNMLSMFFIFNFLKYFLT